MACDKRISEFKHLQIIAWFYLSHVKWYQAHLGKKYWQNTDSNISDSTVISPQHLYGDSIKDHNIVGAQARCQVTLACLIHCWEPSYLSYFFFFIFFWYERINDTPTGVETSRKLKCTYIHTKHTVQNNYYKHSVRRSQSMNTIIRSGHITIVKKIYIFFLPYSCSFIMSRVMMQKTCSGWPSIWFFFFFEEDTKFWL